MRNYLDATGLQDFANQYAEKLAHECASIFATKGEVNPPLVAATAADMTDTDRVYIYVGDETGYTTGGAYYYDSTDEEWKYGWMYQSEGIQTDTTLAVAGMAADAKATGDALATKLSGTDTTLSISGMAADSKSVGDELAVTGSNVSELSRALSYEDSNIQQSNAGKEYLRGNFVRGNINATNGEIISGNYRVINADAIMYSRSIKLTCSSSFQALIAYYDENDEFISPIHQLLSNGTYTMPENQRFRICIRRNTEDQTEAADIYEFLEQITFASISGTILNGIGDGTSIGNDAITFAKRTKAGSVAFVNATDGSSVYGALAFDTINKTLKIPPSRTIMCGRVKYTWSNVSITTIDLTSKASGYLTFDTANPQWKSYAMSAASQSAGENEVIVAAWHGYGEYVITNVPYTINGNLFGIETVNSKIISPDYTSTAFTSISWSDVSMHGSDLWFFKASSDETHTATDGRIYIYDSLMQLKKTILHNFGHCNTVDIRGDKLIIGNLPGNSTYKCAAYILDISGIDELADRAEIDFDDYLEAVIDLTGIVGLTKYTNLTSCSACWGDNNGGENNIVYINTNYNSVWAKILLGKGENQLDYGTYNSGNGFNGTYDVIEIQSFDDDLYTDGNERVTQGMCFYNGKIYTANGDGGTNLRGMIWEFKRKGMERTVIDCGQYDGSGDRVSSFSEGCWVNNGINIGTRNGSGGLALNNLEIN